MRSRANVGIVFSGEYFGEIRCQGPHGVVWVGEGRDSAAEGLAAGPKPVARPLGGGRRIGRSSRVVLDLHGVLLISAQL